jgi:hypothetical protein
VAVEIVEQGRGGAGAGERHHPRQALQTAVVELVEQPRRHHLPLAPHHGIDGPRRVLQQLGGDERGAVAAHEHERPWPARPGGLREVDHLRHVGQIVQREPDRARLELRQLTGVVGVIEHLQIEQAHVVAGRADGGGHPLEPQRLETQVELGVEKRAWMNE